MAPLPQPWAGGLSPSAVPVKLGVARGINSVTRDGEQQGEGGSAGQGQLLCPF